MKTTTTAKKTASKSIKTDDEALDRRSASTRAAKDMDEDEDEDAPDVEDDDDFNDAEGEDDFGSDPDLKEFEDIIPKKGAAKSGNKKDSDMDDDFRDLGLDDFGSSRGGGLDDDDDDF